MKRKYQFVFFTTKGRTTYNLLKLLFCRFAYPIGLVQIQMNGDFRVDFIYILAAWTGTSGERKVQLFDWDVAVELVLFLFGWLLVWAERK